MDKKKTILNEVEYVENPFLRQLERLGWSILRAGEKGKGDPSVTFREGFTEVILEKKLREALLQINPWLQEDQLAPIVRELIIPTNTGGLIENNRYVLEKLLEGTSTENKSTGRPEGVHFIDFANPDKNEFLAISQFKVNIPGTEKHIIPDIVLFVNGLPLVIVECKSAYLPDPMGEAIEQLMRYQNRRGDEPEGNPKLFWYNQILVATSKQICRYASITGEFEHFIEWKDPYPYGLNDIETEGSESVTSQQIFVQGVCEKKNLLDIIQSFIIFQDGGKGKLIKVTPRYQQFRTVSKIIKRLHSGQTSIQKGGIVWHTQGSGKSLTMMMVVRKMYHDPKLTAYKTIFITDRTDLETQLGKTAKGIGYTLKVARTISQLKEYLSNNTPDLVMGMIHKFQEHDLMQEFPLLNESEKVLVLIDEAHRSQFKLLGANLNKSLPNSVKIAFTGTPIDKVEETFGDYIDKYTIRQAVDDGVTVEIIYEGRTHNAAIKDADAMNRKFEDVFADADEETQALIQGRYTWKAYLEAEETIKEKAEDMLKHYLGQIFPNGFKAQVVAVSRLAAIKYKLALDALLADKIWIDAYLASLESKAEIKTDREQLLRMKIEVIISGGNNDDPAMRPYTDDTEHEKIITSFKLPFGKANESGVAGNVGIIIVQSMLLTGFDAPIEQVMYLDDVIREHNLLQAIARVNRIEKNKQAGFIVDYVGVANHLRKALSNFREEDIEETLKVVKDAGRDMDELQYAKAAIIDFFHKYDIKNTDDIDVCVDLLADDEVRNDFLALFRKLSSAMDKALPKPEALKFAKDLKQFGFVAQVARNRYRDEKLNLRDVSKKVRDIIDEYLVSMGVDPKIPPTPIFDEKFELKIKEKTPKVKTEELKHAITDYIEKHEDEDPELYARFSEKLEKMLQQYHENWELLAKELELLRIEMRQGREGEESFGLDRKKELPFLGLLKKEIYGIQDLSELNEEQKDLLVQTTKDILERIKTDIAMVDFWNNVPAQRRLKGYIASHLLTVFKSNEAMFNKRIILSQKITELAFHLYGKN
jgi:type I restriction enzyme R subunit